MCVCVCRSTKTSSSSVKRPHLLLWIQSELSSKYKKTTNSLFHTLEAIIYDHNNIDNI